MGDWQCFQIQKMGMDGNGQYYPVKDSVSQWGVFCRKIPFILQENMKEPAKHSWYDEDGDDEYIPSTGLRAEAYTMKVELGCKLLNRETDATTYGLNVNDVRQSVASFLNYLRTAGMMKIYSPYTRIGRQNVRLKSISNDAKWHYDEDDEWLLFTIELKVNDPITDITLTI